MKYLASLVFALGGVLYAAASPAPLARAVNASLAACQQIATQISSASAVYYPGTPQYITDIYHFSQTQVVLATCAVEPGTAADVAVALKIIGAGRVPFAVKGGGYNADLAFSSTTGVLIAMTRFNRVVVDKASNSVQIGAGLTWIQVYNALEGTGAAVVGSHIGSGVAGQTLMNGFSWISQEYGLTIDTVQQYELVTPQGSVINVTASSNPDLFFGLRGGDNNFGIFTRVWLQAFPAPSQVWGGTQSYAPTQVDAALNACSSYDLANTDPKGKAVCIYFHSGATAAALVSLYYDAPTPPPGLFANFTSIPTLTPDWRSRSLPSLVNAVPSNAFQGQRSFLHSASIKTFSPAIVTAIKTVATKYAFEIAANGGLALNININPFVKGYFQKSKGGAWPHDPSNEFKPIPFSFFWQNPASDAYFQSLCHRVEADFKAAAQADGQLPSPYYLSIVDAVGDTPVSQIYDTNLPRLQAIARANDPQKVMMLTGGFKLQ